MLQAEFSRSRCWDQIVGSRCLGQRDTMKKDRRKQNWEKKTELWCSSQHNLSQLAGCCGVIVRKSCLALYWMAGPLYHHISHFPGESCEPRSCSWPQAMWLIPNRGSSRSWHYKLSADGPLRIWVPRLSLKGGCMANVYHIPLWYNLLLFLLVEGCDDLIPYLFPCSRHGSHLQCISCSSENKHEVFLHTLGNIPDPKLHSPCFYSLLPLDLTQGEGWESPCVWFIVFYFAAETIILQLSVSLRFFMPN